MSSIELRGLEVSQGFWDAMCSLNLIYVKVKAIVLTKERNTINMQSAVAGNTAVADAGSERDVGWGSIEMQPWKTQPGGRCMGSIYYLYFFFSLPLQNWEKLELWDIQKPSEMAPEVSQPVDWGIPAEPSTGVRVPPLPYHILAGLAAETSLWAWT